jgi:hypothetical protein
MIVNTIYDMYYAAVVVIRQYAREEGGRAEKKKLRS